MRGRTSESFGWQHQDVPHTDFFAVHLCAYLCQLGLVESRPCLQLVVSLVASQRVDLKLEKVHLKPQKKKKKDTVK